MSVKITYFAHGTTTDNQAHRATGWNDAGLSERGIEQSKDLKNLTNLDDFDAIFCSDLKRAVDSARLNFGDEAEIIQDTRLRECNYGDLNGAPSDQVVYEDHIFDPFPNGESLTDVEKRLRDFCDYLLARYDGRHIAIVGHRAPSLAFEVIANRKTWDEAVATDWRKTKSWQPGWLYEIK
jgi:broad specificity phosphatase PhoE